MVSCPSGTTFYASTHGSGCFVAGDAPSDFIPNPVYNGTDCSAYNIVQCNPGCSFCLVKNATIPTGCHLCDASNPC
jgi:hypothetical protein